MSQLLNYCMVVFFVLMLFSCADKRKEVQTKEILSVEIQKPIEVSNQLTDTFITPDGWMKFNNSKKVQLDIRYATANNFVKEKMYPCGRCFLEKDAGERLLLIIEELYKKGYKTVLFDCYRPRPIQQRLWDKVPNPSYVTPPAKGSMHNRGLAVDLGLATMDGELEDMGSTFDFFGEEAHQDYFNHNDEILKRRSVLKGTMEKYGFKSIRTEWWHYYYDKKQVSLSDWEWTCD